MVFCNKVNILMTICHKIKIKLQLSVIFSKLIEGFTMLIIIKNAESLFERFENSLELWAEKVF
jgi:hypothetical protein